LAWFDAMGAITHRAGLAQLVEHLICNQGVTSSNLVAGTIFFIKINILGLGAATLKKPA
jgi:hypothetical protein